MTRTLAVLVALALTAVPGAAAAAGCAKTTVADLEDEVMCPVCGTTIGLAREAAQAKRERALIGRLIDSCRSKAEIKEALVTEFGPAVLAEPSDDGFGAAAYAVPVVAGAATVAGVLLALLRWRRRPDDDAPPAAAPGPAAGHASRLDAELDRLR